MTNNLNVSKIRDDFPLLKRQINGKPIIYLDSTASTLKTQQVIDAMNEYYTRYSVNIFRGIYKLSEEATEKYENARKIIADFIGAKSDSEIIFVRNATEAINLVAYAWGRENIDEDSEIISTVMEHHANLVPWQQLALETGATLKFIEISDDGILDMEGLTRALTRKTKLVALTHVSNVLGTINPVKKIISAVKKINPGIKVLIDAAQSVPHMPVDVVDLGCDFLAFSGHKMLGPTGIGVLWGRYDILESMLPFEMGGDMIAEVALDKTTFKKPPHKFEAGTPHIAGAIGLAAAVEYLSKLGMESVRQHEKVLVEYALGRLNDLSYLKIYGPLNPDKKGGVIAFNIKGSHPHDVAEILNRENICIRSGHHCAMPLHTRLNITSSCRASFYVYTTKEEIDALIQSIEVVYRMFHG
jgi:cysteine desulfurase / selenocysteine lyase